MSPPRLIREIHRRSLWQVLGVYLACSWIVIQVVATFVEQLLLPGWVFPGALILLALGLPIVLVTAFLQRGFHSDSAEAATGSARLFTWRNAIAGGVGVFALWGVIAAVWMAMGGTPGGLDAEDGVLSIAVLPFVNSSPDADYEYFSDGIAEELISAIGQMPGVHVAARTSTWQFKGSNLPAQQIADSISVSSVLAGSVRRRGEDVRISAELVNGTDGELLWSNQFEVTVDDLFEAETQIATAIADALQIRLTADEVAQAGRQPRNAQAYDHYLRGRYSLALRTIPGIQEAIGHFSDAIAADSMYALGWAGLGEAWMLGAVWEMPGSALEIYSASMRATDRAIEIDFDLAQPHAVHGFLLFAAGRWEEAETSLVRALEIEPEHTDALQWLAHLYSRLDRYDEAEALIERALRHEPFSRGIASGAAAAYEVFRPEEALAYGYRLIELGHTQAGVRYIWEGLVYDSRLDEALPHAQQWIRGLGGSEEQIEERLAWLDRLFEAFREYQETGGLVEVPRAPLGSFAVDIQFMGGRADRGFEMIDQLFAQDHVALLGIFMRRPIFEFREDPRYNELRRRTQERFGS
jgi:serine/threonine-protein kinase